MVKKTVSEKPVTEGAKKTASQAIQEIEPLAGNKVMVYTSRRSLGPWDIPLMYKLLAEIGKQKRLAIILQSRGGFADDAYKMANVIREFAEDLTFVVPSYAKSAASLLCLSGNRILMGPISELGPTNPMMSVDERLITPTLPVPSGSSKEPEKRQMATHALRDFLEAAGVLKSGGSGYDPEVLSVYMGKGILNPFLLGEFERSSKIAVQYAENLLVRHMFCGRDNVEGLATETAKKLCEGYYDHNYPIDRTEAREILHLTVEDMSNELWERTSELMLAYDEMMSAQNIATIVETSLKFQVVHFPTSA